MFYLWAISYFKKYKYICFGHFLLNFTFLSFIHLNNGITMQHWWVPEPHYDITKTVGISYQEMPERENALSPNQHGLKTLSLRLTSYWFTVNSCLLNVWMKTEKPIHYPDIHNEDESIAIGQSVYATHIYQRRPSSLVKLKTWMLYNFVSGSMICSSNHQVNFQFLIFIPVDVKTPHYGKKRQMSS